MNILNRYILRQFMKPFIASFLALCILLFVSQLFDRLDRFLAHGVSWTFVIGYLATWMPFQALQILPVACLLATLFVVGTLARTKEYIAGLAGGIAPEKFLGGIMMAGFVLSLLALGANETFIPPAARYSTRVYKEKIQRLGGWHQSVFMDVCVAGGEGRVWRARQFNQDSGQMERVVVDTMGSGKMGLQVDALSAQWTKDGWIFYDGVLRSVADDGSGLVLNESFKEKLLPFFEKPSDLVTQEPTPEEMTYKALKKHIRQLSALGIPVRKLEVELMMKLSFPFACFVVTCLGIPLAMRGKGNRAMGIASAAALALVYMGFIQFGKAMAQRLIPPLLGAWFGNIVFMSIALFLWWRLKRTA